MECTAQDRGDRIRNSPSDDKRRTMGDEKPEISCMKPCMQDCESMNFRDPGRMEGNCQNKCHSQCMTERPRYLADDVEVIIEEGEGKGGKNVKGKKKNQNGKRKTGKGKKKNNGRNRN